MVLHSSSTGALVQQGFQQCFIKKGSGAKTSSHLQVISKT